MRKSLLPIALITTALVPLLGTSAHAADVADPTYFAVNTIFPPPTDIHAVPYNKCDYGYSLTWTNGTQRKGIAEISYRDNDLTGSGSDFTVSIYNNLYFYSEFPTGSHAISGTKTDAVRAESIQGRDRFYALTAYVKNSSTGAFTSGPFSAVDSDWIP